MIKIKFVATVLSAALILNSSIAHSEIDQRWLKGEFRGFNLSSYQSSRIDRESFKRLTEYRANLVRVAVHINKDQAGLYEIGPQDRQFLDKMLKLSSEFNVPMVITFEIQPPGDKADYWKSDSAKEQLAVIWQKLAKELKGNKNIAGFDLINEPVVPTWLGVLRGDIWSDWASYWTTRIREADPDRTVIFEPAPWGLAKGFEKLKPLPFNNLVYSFHSYSPHELTHQGINGYQKGMSYPGKIKTNGDLWDYSKLEESAQAVIHFSKKYKVPIYVGEFSIINNADFPSRINYVKDSLKIFSKNQFSWTYHAYREWTGWDPEVANQKGVSPEQTESVKSVLDLLIVNFKETNTPVNSQ